MPSAAAVLPIKAFDAAKSRLSPTVDPDTRRLLAMTMAERVLAACSGMPTFVATDDEQVAEWAAVRSATVVWSAGLDLNDSVVAGVAAARTAGHGRLVISHADLPFAKDLVELTWFPGATLVPDRAGDGTNVVSIPTSASFVPMYGPGSFSRHLDQLRRSVPVRIARRSDLQWDVDVPADIPASLRHQSPV